MVAPPLLIGAICNHLSKDQELQDQLRSNPDQIPSAVEEFLRLYTPYRGFSRTTSKDVCMHQRTISPGEPVTISYSAANVRITQRTPAYHSHPTATFQCISSSASAHAPDLSHPATHLYLLTNFQRDPSEFENPDTFIMDRPNIRRHLGFGRGRHQCAGMPLARLAIQVALEVLLRDTTRLEVNGPLAYARMPEMGITSCPLRIEI